MKNTFGTAPYARLISRTKFERNRDNDEQLTIYKNDYFAVPQCWYVKPGSFLVETFDKFILEMHQHGILKHLEDRDKPQKVAKPEEAGPQILTMYMLSAGFIVWISTVAFACLVFACEHIHFKFAKTTREKLKIKKGHRVDRKYKHVVKSKIKNVKKRKLASKWRLDKKKNLKFILVANKKTDKKTVTSKTKKP